MLLDSLIGDPHWLPHPIRLIGNLISALEKKLYPENHRNPKKELALGRVLCAVVIVSVVLAVFLLTAITYRINLLPGIICESILTFYALAARSLCHESLKVSKALEAGDIGKARTELSYIVGRDTDVLDREGILRAAVETVSENTSDGIIAPLLFAMIFGPVGAYFYKAVNTMDSMIGYKNDRYESFGRCAAKLDDAVNFLPSRLSALLMIAAAFICSLFSHYFNGANAFRIWQRDRLKHTSPNSAQTESTCAGALGIVLGGPSYYGGVLKKKPFLGDDQRSIEDKDVSRACFLAIIPEWLLALLFSAIIVILLL